MTDRALILWHAIAACAVVAIIATASLMTPAAAHSWFPQDCCSDKDCMVIPESAIIETPEGFTIRETGEFLNRSDPRIRETPIEGGGDFAWCRHLKDGWEGYAGYGEGAGRRIKKGDTICLFVPGRGV